MYKASLDRNKTITIANYKLNYKDRVTCPLCDSSVIAKRGAINAHHFAHKALRDCDQWYDNSQFKLEWLKHFNDDDIEITCKNINEKHRADVKFSDKLIIQFYQKSMGANEWIDRVDFYKEFVDDLIIVVDCRGKKIFPKSNIRLIDYLYKYGWKTYSKTILSSKNIKGYHLFLQTDEDELLLTYDMTNHEDWREFSVSTILTKNEFLQYSKMISQGKNPIDVLRESKFINEKLKEEIPKQIESLMIKSSNCENIRKKLLKHYNQIELYRKLELKDFTYKLINLRKNSINNKCDKEFEKIKKGKDKKKAYVNQTKLLNRKNAALSNIEKRVKEDIIELESYNGMSTENVKNLYIDFIKAEKVNNDLYNFYKAGNHRKTLEIVYPIKDE